MPEQGKQFLCGKIFRNSVPSKSIAVTRDFSFERIRSTSGARHIRGLTIRLLARFDMYDRVFSESGQSRRLLPRVERFFPVTVSNTSHFRGR